jgi:hypothetical protein
MAWDQKLTGMLTGAASDCGLQPGGWSVIAVKLTQQGRGGR